MIEQLAFGLIDYFRLSSDSKNRSYNKSCNSIAATQEIAKGQFNFIEHSLITH